MRLRVGRLDHIPPAKETRFTKNVTVGPPKTYVTKEYLAWLMETSKSVKKVYVRRIEFEWVSFDALVLRRLAPSWDLIEESVDVVPRSLVPIACSEAFDTHEVDFGDAFASRRQGGAAAPRTDAPSPHDDHGDAIIGEDSDEDAAMIQALSEALHLEKAGDGDEIRGTGQDEDGLLSEHGDSSESDSSKHGDSDDPEVLDPLAAESIAASAVGLLRCPVNDVRVKWDSRSLQVWEVNSSGHRLRLLGTGKWIRKDSFKLTCDLPEHKGRRGESSCGVILYGRNRWAAVDTALDCFFSYAASYKCWDHCTRAHHDSVAAVVKARLARTPPEVG